MTYKQHRRLHLYEKKITTTKKIANTGNSGLFGGGGVVNIDGKYKTKQGQ